MAIGVGKETELDLFKTIVDVIENNFKEYCTLYDFHFSNQPQTQLNLIELLNEKINKQTLEERFRLVVCLPETSILKQSIESELLQNTQNEAQDLIDETKRLKTENSFWSKPAHLKRLTDKAEELHKLHQFVPNNLILNRTIKDYVTAIISVTETYQKENDEEIHELIESIKKVKTLPQKEINEIVKVIDAYQNRNKITQDDLIKLIKQVQELAAKEQQKSLQTQLNKLMQQSKDLCKEENVKKNRDHLIEDGIIMIILCSLISLFLFVFVFAILFS